MLSPADADLVRRDRQIPGLAVVLDPDAFASVLRNRLPDLALDRVRPTYLRYKAGTSCLAGFQLEVAGEFVDVYARAGSSNQLSQFDDERTFAPKSGPLGVNRLALPDLAISVAVFPNDDKLTSLPLVTLPESRERTLTKILPNRPDLWVGDVQKLRYKPERRFVGQLLDASKTPGAVLRMYCEADYQIAQANAKWLGSGHLLQIASRLGRSNRHRVLILEWIPGRLLQDMIADASGNRATIARCGIALAELHGQSAKHLTSHARDIEAHTLVQVARGLGEVCPALATRAAELAQRLAALIVELPRQSRPIHGDFYAKQVIVTEQTIAFLDLDQATQGDPAADLGLFIAHLESDVIGGHLRADHARFARDALLSGYECATHHPPPGRVDLYVAANLVRLAPHPFRRREPDWRDQTEATLLRVEEILSERQANMSANWRGMSPGDASMRLPGRSENIDVSDRFGAIDDPELPFLAMALDPHEVQCQFARHLPAVVNGDGTVDVRAIRTVRHKIGLRCMVEYDCAVDRPGTRRETITLLGKARARSLDTTSFQLLERLWNEGFGSKSEDGILVPQPIGEIPKFNMWFQRKVPGTVATHLLAGTAGTALARRIAEAIHKLHNADVPARRHHTMTDELRILHERLPLVGVLHPGLASRLEHVLDACERLGASVPALKSCGIHRDFYSDQVLVDGERLYLLDFDLYCEGDPGLDIGNFIGHITELSLRTTGKEDGLLGCEQAMEDRFVELSGEATRVAVRAYTILTLARHIYLSTRFPERQPFTENLLDLCERRLLSSTRRLPRMSGRPAFPGEPQTSG